MLLKWESSNYQSPLCTMIHWKKTYKKVFTKGFQIECTSNCHDLCCLFLRQFWSVFTLYLNLMFFFYKPLRVFWHFKLTFPRSSWFVKSFRLIFDFLTLPILTDFCSKLILIVSFSFLFSRSFWSAFKSYLF